MDGRCAATQVGKCGASLPRTRASVGWKRIAVHTSAVRGWNGEAVTASNDPGLSMWCMIGRLRTKKVYEGGATEGTLPRPGRKELRGGMWENEQRLRLGGGAVVLAENLRAGPVISPPSSYERQ